MKAYILINTESGTEIDIVRKLTSNPNIKEVHRIFGLYDAIAEIRDLGLNSVMESVDAIRKIPGVVKTITNIVADVEIDIRDTHL
ncbi:MAG: Lrp/AsnC ligand binding domain-containing protein [Candidatus Ranarchaeia archaeon]